MKKIFSTIILNENILFLRAKLITGYHIIDIIKWLNYPINNNSIKDKGLIGKLVEYYLIGEKQNNKLNQDIPYLGIEIKTITINLKNKILNDSFICSFPLLIKNNLSFYKKKLYEKISKILWIPIITKSVNTHIFKKKIGNPFFWEPSTKDKIKLDNDWNNLIKLLIIGQLQNINYYNGYILLVKNKSNTKQLTKTINKNGKILYISPKAFYFKKKYLNSLFQFK
ncbi:hypothetical protein GJT99_02035 [Enterobacteriaceae endosymbiont of Donacia cincticornis]|uniref:MutH/Sau3AI family endonuclease n=1 Tax=Enterobacteriaceae endosymbiont of Donacia cincticornis TaxID=2675773 RepID=UPI00144A2705|nr:MutH/Sau3AI family endonuclease [Enterobacteriaceae endosymbiont of Donacia cincticornis]QJC36272.1 hypothetical protein GJT99_02035 [Enterobacteriaceae endosymbiont of Donacia cincticornis]